MAEMVQQPAEVPVPLQLFGGLVTEMSPSDLPEGVSPDCQDVVFFPGGVSSRPATDGWLTGLLPIGVTVTYMKSFVTPSGATKNIILDSAGNLWVQDTSNPTHLILIDMVAPGSFATSVSAFGKEYLTFHNNSIGTDVPRIYDGTFYDRATQDGPGAAPGVNSLLLQAVNMAPLGSAPTTPITSITPQDLTTFGRPPYQVQYYLRILVVVGSTANITPGQYVSFSGCSNAVYDQNWGVDQVINSTQFTAFATLPSTTTASTGGTCTVGSATTASRSGNSVLISTAAAHQLQVGFQCQISGIPDQVVGTSISSIVINNETLLGQATITTSAAHGLLPGNIVNLIGVANIAVGGGISAISRSAQITSVVTASAHNLRVGSTVQIAGVTDNTYNGEFVVAAVPSATSFTYVQPDTDSTSTGGTVSLVWPVSNNTILPNTYTVIATPTPTTFTVAINYADGTWTSGSVTFPWNGTFYVTQILSATEFRYQQYGPNATTTSVGLVTPYSQISPGIRRCVVMFQLRTGLITAPSPYLQFISNGGQYLTIANIPIGPPNTIARIIAFTGADGANFFYIPLPAQSGGITISTSTVINDNVTTSLLVDFSDLTLFDSTAIDIPGNNLFNLGVLGPCLGVKSYASRNGWFGMRNSLSNLINMGFDGGYTNTTGLGVPLGWTVFGAGGTLSVVNVNSNFGWIVTTSGSGFDGGLSQTGYFDIYNVPIFEGDTEYGINLWLALISNVGGVGGQVNFEIYSPTSGSLALGTLPISSILAGGSFHQITFNNFLPAVIPTDTVFRLYISGAGVGTQISFDDMEIYNANDPIVPQFLFSYVNLPDSVDLETGALGATDDDNPLQGAFTYRDELLFLTTYGLHTTSDLAGYEPSNWRVREVATHCGCCGPKALTSGENFSCWVTSPSTQPPVGRGLYLYEGGAVYKLSQEIQPAFDSVNPAAQNSIWACNDAINRRVYVGLPVGSATAPDVIYVMDYREMNTALEIAEKAPIHISFTGKMICSDLSRKWTRWSLATNCGEIITIPGIGVQFSIGAGTGIAPVAFTTGAFRNAYWFNSSLYTDQDYGQITPYYTTYFFVNHELEQAIQVGAHRKLYKRYATYVQGLGDLEVTPLGNSLMNPWPASFIPLSSNQLYDLGDSLNTIAERCAFKFGSIPLTGTDNWFNMNKFIITMAQEPVAPIRFGAI